MGNSIIDETFQVYVQMRTGGKDTKATLDALRTRIELMSTADRAEMVRRVKIWESGSQKGDNSKAVKPIAGRPAARAAKKGVGAEATGFCQRCGMQNGASELFCTRCGNFLGGETSPHETVRLHDPDAARSADYFGEDSTLLLSVPAANFTYTIQPQRNKHETVIGRSEGSTMRPDIDLSEHNAGELGVSRLHVALQYNAKNNLLSLSDMKSANGTFINGQKLYPQEVRVLRDGDELRLGRMVLRAYFKHGE